MNLWRNLADWLREMLHALAVALDPGEMGDR